MWVEALSIELVAVHPGAVVVDLDLGSLPWAPFSCPLNRFCSEAENNPADAMRYVHSLLQFSSCAKST